MAREARWIEGWRRKKRWEVMKTVADNRMENERR